VRERNDPRGLRDRLGLAVEYLLQGSEDILSFNVDPRQAH
jgi:hypothetical protein